MQDLLLCQEDRHISVLGPSRTFGEVKSNWGNSIRGVGCCRARASVALQVLQLKLFNIDVTTCNENGRSIDFDNVASM